MTRKPFALPGTAAGRNRRWRGFRSAFALAQALCTSALWAAGTHTVTLEPAKAPPLRIDFNYNFAKALPPFEKEPALANKETARGLIPTVPPTAFLRNITDNELYLNRDHTRDLVNGNLATYRSFYNGHVIFTNLDVATVRDGVEIPYTVQLITYERFCAGWLNVQSGWTGEVDVAGHRWKLTVVDNLDGEIGRSDTLHLQRMDSEKASHAISISPVPPALFLDGHAFDLGFKFQQSTANSAVLQAVLTETNLPLGTLNISSRQCEYLCLSNASITVVIDGRNTSAAVPTGSYAVSDCLLETVRGAFQQPAFIRCDQKVEIRAGVPATLKIGPPLRNTVQVNRDRNTLRLTYRLLGEAGEQYEYYNWRDRPRFAVSVGPIRIGSGRLPFG